jgi:son of sevenless
MNMEVCRRLSEVDLVSICSLVDPNFIKTFLMTFKSFTTVDELFELLVLRFNIQPPPNLTPEEHQDWVKLKQHVIQMR